MNDHESPIDRAIRIVGGQRQLAQALGVTYQAVQKFRRRVPAERVLQIEKTTGVSRHELRPDIYPLPTV
jgi:DNA-binding transcriptional regulator YdaS (Cro superfamily)